MLNIKNTKKGFSLVEMLVAIAIFMSIMVIAVSSLLSIIDANRKAQTIKSTIDSVTFAIEDISRNMRSGTDYMCMLQDGSFSKVCSLSGSSAIQYTDNTNTIVTYRFNGTIANPVPTSPGIITRKIGSLAVEDIISQDTGINITNMKFYVIGSENETNPNMSLRTQPRVIVTASGLITLKGGGSTTFNLQTNISQRTRR